MPDVETLIEVPVIELDQITVPAQSLTVRLIFVPSHTLLSTSSETTIGAFGIGLTVKLWIFEERLEHKFSVQVAL